MPCGMTWCVELAFVCSSFLFLNKPLLHSNIQMNIFAAQLYASCRKYRRTRSCWSRLFLPAVRVLSTGTRMYGRMLCSRSTRSIVHSSTSSPTHLNSSKHSWLPKATHHASAMHSCFLRTAQCPVLFNTCSACTNKCLASTSSCNSRFWRSLDWTASKTRLTVQGISDSCSSC